MHLPPLKAPAAQRNWKEIRWRWRTRARRSRARGKSPSFGRRKSRRCRRTASCCGETRLLRKTRQRCQSEFGARETAFDSSADTPLFTLTHCVYLEFRMRKTVSHQIRNQPSQSLVGRFEEEEQWYVPSFIYSLIQSLIALHFHLPPGSIEPMKPSLEVKDVRLRTILEHLGHSEYFIAIMFFVFFFGQHPRFCSDITRPPGPNRARPRWSNAATVRLHRTGKRR